MKLTFCWLAPPRSRMVKPVVSRMWLKNSSRPRLGREETMESEPRPPKGERGAEDWPLGAIPCGPPRWPRKRPFSGSNIGIARRLAFVYAAAGAHRRVRGSGRRGSGLRRFRSGLGLRLHDIDAALEICAVFDNDAGGADIAGQLGILAD